ncbi:MAG: DUF3048 domain-containing protein [Acetivibrio sp.]
MKKIRIICILVLLSLTITGCEKKEKQRHTPAPAEIIVKETPTPTLSPTETPVETHEGMEKSKLTGLWVDKKIANRRPIAMMINNIKVASPQTGTGEASILYEAVVEGGITRMMALFEDISGDRIGSVRSARHYFVSFADEYDAIYAHFGQTKYATAKIKELKVDNLSGLEAIGSTVYYRDTSIRAPHNAFASAKGVWKGIEKKGYPTELRENMKNHFTFYEEDTDFTKGESASKKITLGYSGYTSPYFTYNKKDKLYYRYQFDTPHIDKGTGKQLAFKNIILQYVSYWTIDSKNGYQSMDIEDSKGEGLYISNGKAMKITWDKKESKKEMHYYDEEGNLLTINPGKTYIGLYPANHLEKLDIQ